MLKKAFVLLAALLMLVSVGAICESQTEITADFTVSVETAQIGHPLEIAYSLMGGSGAFEDVTIQAEYVHCSGTSYSSGASEQINSASGSFTIIPDEGSAISVSVYGHDTAGKEFFIYMDYEIPVEPNPDLPVSISFSGESVQAGETLTAEYGISGCESFSGDAWWTIGEKGEYWDEYSRKLDEQEIEGTAGALSYAPSFGDYIYLSIQGQDESGRPVYVESEPVAIGSSAGTGILVLPADLIRIDSGAFTGTAAEGVVVPATVNDIADDAFENSTIKTLYGTTDYVRDYAAAHNLEFAEAE